MASLKRRKEYAELRKLRAETRLMLKEEKWFTAKVLTGIFVAALATIAAVAGLLVAVFKLAGVI